MTLPLSGVISLSDVLNELRVGNTGRGLPISLGDADVRALAGVPTGQVPMTALYGKAVAGPLTATGNNDYVYGITGNVAGTLTAAPSVSAGGGSGTKSFVWSFLSNPSNCTLSNATSQQCAVSKTFIRYSSGAATAYLRCVVSDSTGSVTVDNIVASFEWESGQ